MSDVPQPVETGGTTFEAADTGMAQAIFNYVNQFDEIDVRYVPASGKYAFHRTRCEGADGDSE